MILPLSPSLIEYPIPQLSVLEHRQLLEKIAEVLEGCEPVLLGRFHNTVDHRARPGPFGCVAEQPPLRPITNGLMERSLGELSRIGREATLGEERFSVGSTFNASSNFLRACAQHPTRVTSGRMS